MKVNFAKTEMPEVPETKLMDLGILIKDKNPEVKAEEIKPKDPEPVVTPEPVKAEPVKTEPEVKEVAPPKTEEDVQKKIDESGKKVLSSLEMIADLEQDFSTLNSGLKLVHSKLKELKKQVKSELKGVKQDEELAELRSRLKKIQDACGLK